MSNVTQGILRTLVAAAAIFALSAGTASAQSFSPLTMENKRPLTQEEVDKQNALDSAYKSAINKLPEKKTVDPWGNVRADPPKAIKKKQ
jgi:hypothetical protein